MLIPLAARDMRRVNVTLAILTLCACAPDSDVAPPSATSSGPAKGAPSERGQSEDGDLATALVYGGRHLKRDEDEHEKAAELLEAAGIGVIVTHGLFGYLVWVRPVDQDRSRAILLANDVTKAGVSKSNAK